MWHVSSRGGVATLRTAIHLLLTYLLTYYVLCRRCVRWWRARDAASPCRNRTRRASSARSSDSWAIRRNSDSWLVTCYSGSVGRTRAFSRLRSPTSLRSTLQPPSPFRYSGNFVCFRRRKLRQASPSNNFAARLVRLMRPLNILVNRSLSINPLNFISYFNKLGLFVPDILLASLYRHSPSPHSIRHPIPFYDHPNAAFGCVRGCIPRINGRAGVRAPAGPHMPWLRPSHNFCAWFQSNLSSAVLVIDK